MTDSPWPRQQVLRLEGIRVRRGTGTILDIPHLAFEPGRRYVLIGPSGSGKSTLLRLLNRLDDADEGRLFVGDLAMPGLPVRDVRGSVGLVFQSPRPMPGTIAENLSYPQVVRGRPSPDRSEMAVILDELGLDPMRLDHDAAALSGGERQRLAIATALLMGPEILAMDEPTSALDPASSRRLASCLARRAEEGLRTIIVTHDRAQVDRLGDTLVRLDGGKVVDEGEMAEMLARADASTWAEEGSR